MPTQPADICGDKFFFSLVLHKLDSARHIMEQNNVLDPTKFKFTRREKFKYLKSFFLMTLNLNTNAT